MKKNCVIISAKGKETFNPSQQRQLEDVFNVTFVENLNQLTPEKLIEIAEKAQILAITRRSATDINREILAELKNLQGLAIYATGYEWVDLDYCETNNIKVKYLEDYSADTVAEHTLGMLLTLSRRLHMSHDKSRNMAAENISLRGFELKNKTFGIWGFGTIGKKFAELIQPFSDNIFYYDLEKQNSGSAVYKAKDDLLFDCDIIIMLANKTRDEEPLISLTEINKMKDGVVIINSSRSALVDNQAILDGIKNKKIFGYAVDDKIEIFNSQEIEYGRIFQTYHTGWYSDESISRGTEQWVQNILSLDKEVL